MDVGVEEITRMYKDKLKSIIIMKITICSVYAIKLMLLLQYGRKQQLAPICWIKSTQQSCKKCFSEKKLCSLMENAEESQVA